MSLLRVARVSIAACAAGFLALAVLAVVEMGQLRERQASMENLLSLSARLSQFSAASDNLLVSGADPALWETYRRDARDLAERLRTLGEEHPDALKAAHQVESIVDSLETAGVAAPLTEVEQGRAADAQPRIGPLGLPLGAHARLTQIAGHGIALDSALEDALAERRADIAGNVTIMVGGFAAAAVAFAGACVFAFMLMHRRISGPVRELQHVVQRLEAGDDTARVPVRGHDELAQLGQAFNTMLDERAEEEAALREQQRRVERSEAMLAESQRIAAVGSWREDVRSGTLECSLETYRILGLSPESWTPTPGAFLERVHADDRERVQIARAAARAGRVTADLEYRIVRPDGVTRELRERTERQTDHAGTTAVLTGALQDVTELRRTEAALREQRHLVDIAGHMARLGGWSVDLRSRQVTWSDVVAEIHGMAPGHAPDTEEGFAFYTPASRERIRQRFEACAQRGEPFDEILEIVNQQGERLWVRCAAEPVRDQHGAIVRVRGAFQDISMQKAGEDERAQLADRLRATVESITDAFFTVDGAGRFDYVNTAAEDLLGASAAELAGRAMDEVMPPVLGERFQQECRRALTDGVTVAMEEYCELAERWFDIRAYPASDGLTVYFRDTTIHHELVQQLLDHEARLLASRRELNQTLATRQALIHSLPAHIALLDSSGTILDVNDRWREYGAANGFAGCGFGVGYNYLSVCDTARGDASEEAPAVSAGIRAVLAGERNHYALEYPCHSPGEKRWFRVQVNRLAPEYDGDDGVGAVVMHVDITERKLAEEELNRLAYEDALTGAASRNGFARTLEERFQRDGWAPQAMVVMLDVRGQRDINEAHGFAAGDELLVRISERLQDNAGAGALVGRTGGDEFVVYLPVAEGRGPERARAGLAATFAEPFVLGGSRVEIAARFGYTELGATPRGPERLLREAEMALYYPRQSGASDLWSVYTSELDEETHQRIQTTDELRRALAEDQFELHFQPKVDLASGDLLAAEALLRWNHPERGLQPPGLFVPVAEQSQLIEPIGAWALNEACRCMRFWEDAGLSLVPVSVNVSVVQFAGGDFPRIVERALADYGVAPEHLTLEITESVFEQESELLSEQLRALHAMGVRLSLDDFGTGYSSLLYLQRYPFDEIKADKAFVFNILDDVYSAKVVSTVLGLAGALEADVVAEGIESDAVGRALLAMGCWIGQGYHYSVPLAAEDFQWLLECRSPLPLGSAATAATENDSEEP